MSFSESYIEKSEKVDTLEKDENTLDMHKYNSMYLPHVSASKELDNTLGERKLPISILRDDFCEELASLYIFPKKKREYYVEKDLKISSSKYLYQRLLNQLFASDHDYTFFALSVKQQLKLQSEINIATKNFCIRYLFNCWYVDTNFRETAKSFIKKHEAYYFVPTFKGITACRKNFFTKF